jgi:predicted transcriptional regulator
MALSAPFFIFDSRCYSGNTHSAGDVHVNNIIEAPEDLKKRAASAAHEMGLSPHAFMVSAIEQAATAAEQRLRFVADAKAARAEVIETGKGYEADEVHAYLRSKVAGSEVAKPKARPWHA